MFCSNCGHEIEEGAAFCSSCHVPIRAVTGSSEVAARARQELGQGSRDAGAFLKSLFLKPGAGVADGVAGMGSYRAALAGGLLSLAIAVVVGLGAMGIFESLFGGFGEPGLWKPVLVGLLPPLALAAVRAGSRKLFGRGGSLGQDLLGSAGVFLPWALAVLLGRFIGVGNFEVLVVIGVAALVFFVVGLHETARGVAGMSATAAPAVVTVEILAAAWLVKIVGVALW